MNPSSRSRTILSVLAICTLSGIFPAWSASLLPWLDLGGSKFANWSGLGAVADSAATLAAPGTAVFRYPDGPHGITKHGYRLESDSHCDWLPYAGLRCDVELPDGREADLVFEIAAPNTVTRSVVKISGAGWHTITLPWKAFDFPQAAIGFLKMAKQLSVTADFADGKPGQIELRNPRVILAPSVAIQSEVLGKAGAKGATVEYPVTVSNCTDQPETVALSFIRRGWETMSVTAEPASMQLAPGESKPCIVRVTVDDRVPPGGHEEQILQAIANGDAGSASTLDFITTSGLPHPYLVHTSAEWQEVRDKVKAYPWAKAQQDAIVAQAEQWNAPEIAQPPHNDPDDTMGPFLFATQNENGLMACAYAWQLTRDKRYAEKIATFLRRLSDPQNGYPKTYRASSQSIVQEGHFSQHVAMSYDMILDSGVLSDADRQQIDTTLRLLMETMNLSNLRGAINNWNLAEVTGALYCALAMQDLSQANRFLCGPGGLKDQLAKGTMDDGWWYECSIGYNMWCASEFTQAALALRPFGINFKDEWVPASYSRSAPIYAELNGGKGPPVAKPFGMDPEIFGPTLRPWRAITDLWNSMLPFLDWRGVMFGVNDSTESAVTGYRTEVAARPFEIAYYAYRDPKYASVIKMAGGVRDLIYGVPDLPEKTPELFRNDAYADNVGLVALRSQTSNRPIRDQIQAVLHYGTHGWAHGHFDRTDLLSLMRYGRSFWNPESVFYVYEPFMYKFYTQTSVNHNMVVVDEKMQEATPGSRVLYHQGKMMQASVVETTARWSNPPYGGMVYDYVPVKTFEEKTWREGRYVPIPKNPPAYGSITGYTEPIFQRRMLIVTDDYIVLADYLHGAKKHTYESLLQLKGFKGLEADRMAFLRHDAQWNPDPVGSGQFVTDCNWYSVQAPAVARFEEQWGPGADNEGSRDGGVNENGVLNLDVHTLWPKAQDIMVATAPELHHVEKRLFYTVRGDGKSLADGKFGAWILGQADIDIPLAGVKQLELETRTELASQQTLFWAEARIITRDGKEIPLSQLPTKLENIATPPQAGSDYMGGPIKIAGNSYHAGLPAEPKDEAKSGFVRVDLSGVDAVRFKAVLGSDYPLGPETQRRKVFAVRSQGKEARFLTVIEPYETAAMVQSAEALGPDKLRVTLTDGRVQEMSIQNFTGAGKDIGVSITESRDGNVVRSEQTGPVSTTTPDQAR
jgi:hypothetical protein